MGGYTPIQIMPIRPENRQQQQFAADRRCWRPPGPEARTMVAAAATGAAWGWIPGIPGRHRGRRAEAQRRARAVRPWRTASAERKHALRSTSPSCRAAAAAAAAAGRSRRRGSGRHCSRRGAPRTAVDGSARWSAWKVRCADVAYAPREGDGVLPAAPSAWMMREGHAGQREKTSSPRALTPRSVHARGVPPSVLLHGSCSRTGCKRAHGGRALVSDALRVQCDDYMEAMQHYLTIRSPGVSTRS
jgi:hypothetical protein